MMKIKLIPIESIKEEAVIEYGMWYAPTEPPENISTVLAQEYWCEEIRCKSKTLKGAKREATRVLGNLVSSLTSINPDYITFYIVKHRYVPNIHSVQIVASRHSSLRSNWVNHGE